MARTGLTQPGTSKHLRVLRDAGLVSSQTEGQQRIYALDVRPWSSSTPGSSLPAGLGAQPRCARTAPRPVEPVTRQSTIETDAHFERLSHPVDRVWQAITDPDWHWFPSRSTDWARRDEFTFDTAARRLDARRGPSSIPAGLRAARTTCVELDRTADVRAPHGALGRATRPHATRPAGTCASTASSAGRGEDGPAVTGASGEWRELYDEYQRRGAPAGAEIPGD